MTKKINLSLYKNLLFCDFFLIRQNFCKIVKSKITLKASFKTYQNGNLLELLKSIKQTIHLINFSIKKQFDNIIIKIENLLFLHFITFFLKKYAFVANFLNFTSFLKIFNSTNKQTNYLYFFINNSLLLKEKQIQKLLNNEVYLINLIKLENSIKDQGIYKINTDLFDFKQVLFFIILLNKIVTYYLYYYSIKK